MPGQESLKLNNSIVVEVALPWRNVKDEVGPATTFLSTKQPVRLIGRVILQLDLY